VSGLPPPQKLSSLAGLPLITGHSYRTRPQANISRTGHQI
jgi:hypothetical protein